MTEQTISIDTGLKKIPVSVDGNNTLVLEFNSNDLLFVEKLHAIYFEAKEKAKELQALDAVKPETDENGVMVEFGETKAQIEEINQWFREKIDGLFSDGISQKLFGDMVYSSPSVYVQLIEGLFSVVGPARQQKIEKYTKRKK